MHAVVSSTAPHSRGPAVALSDNTGPMQSASSSLSFDEEFTRLKEDLAVERAERHALASRVEALLRLQQKTGSRRSGSPPSLLAATPEDTPTPPTADPSIATGSQAVHSGYKPHVAGIHSDAQHECIPSLATETSPSLESAAGGDDNTGWWQTSSGATQLHVLKRPDLSESRNWQGSDSERPPERFQRVAEHLPSRGESGKAAEGNAVQDAMLADARAILAELEQDLACSGPASSKPDVVATSASEELMRPLLAETADVPHVLSFYRRKCLELATQVQKRDTEVVNLRRALNEARSMGGGCG